MAEEEPPAPAEAQPLTAEAFEFWMTVFDEIFADCHAEAAKAASLAERKENAESLTQKGLTYSEVDLPVINRLLNVLKADHGPFYEGKGVFLDLGSGAGKACIAAGLLHPFEKVVGVELLQSLTDMATKALTKYQEVQLPEGVAKTPVEFVKGDFVAEFDAKIAPLAPTVSVCLAASTCFAEEQMGAMTSLAKLMPENSILITFTRRLPEALVIDLDRHPAQRRAEAVKKALCVRGADPDAVEVVPDPPENDPNGWTPIFSEEVQLAWGSATCFVYKKVPAEGGAEAPADEQAPAEPPAEA